MQSNTEQHIKGGVDLSRVRAALGPVLSAHGVSLVDLEWTTDRAGWTLRVTIERPGSLEDGGGVTLEDCAEVSRDSSAVLDVEDLIPQHYHLEVSSPGLDRPLRTEDEFARFTGRLVKVKLSKPAPDGQRVLRGLLDDAGGGKVAVVVDGKRIEAPFADVVEANLVFELSSQPKRGPHSRSPGQPKKGAPQSKGGRAQKHSGGSKRSA
jgi:ribosome maturation factor RimP